MNTHRVSKEIIIWALSVLTLVSPLLFFQYFPSQDGSAHINSALVLNQLDHGSQFLNYYFRDTGFITTNWATTVLLKQLNKVLSIPRLESGFVLVYLMLMTTIISVTICYLFRINFGYSVAFFLLLYTHMLHMGSYNYSLATIPLLLLLGLLHRLLLKPSILTLSIIAITLIAIFTLHVQIAILALALCGTYSLWILFSTNSGNFNSRAIFDDCHWYKRLKWKDSISLLVCCIPTIILCVLFLIQNHNISSEPRYSGLIMKFFHLVFLSGIASYSLYGLCVSLLIFLSILIGVGNLYRNRNNIVFGQPIDCLLICSIMLFIIFLIMPDGLGDAFNIEERLMIPLLLCFISWLLVKGSSQFTSRNVALIGLFLLVLQTIDRSIAFNNINQTLDEYSEVSSHIPDQSSVIVINMDQVTDHKLVRDITKPFQLALRFDPERAFMGTVLGKQETALISNYEALSIRPYFSLKYQPWLEHIIGKDDMDVIASNELKSNSLSLMVQKLKASPHPNLYLATWVMHPDSKNIKLLAVSDVIDTNFDKVFTSSQTHLNLFKLK